MEYDWIVDKYINLIEKSSNPYLQNYMKVELDYLVNKIDNSKDKTFIDVGAGYGRVVSVLSGIGNKVLAVERDKQMLSELRKRVLQYKNVSVVECDAQELSINLKDFKIDRPVVICLQNSLGTPYGDPYKIISEMTKVAQNNGELIISLYKQDGLKYYGISIYGDISELSGGPDIERINFADGDFISKTGYKSHWWRQEERAKIISLVGGEIVAEIENEYFYILHVKY